MTSPEPRAGWREECLGDLVDVHLGGTPSTTVAAFWGGDVPWMASGDVHAKTIDDVPGRITRSGLASSNAQLVEPPTVAIALAGQGKTRGTVAYVRSPISTNQSVALLRPRNSSIDARFLFHNLGHRYEELRNWSLGGGRAGLSRRVLATIPIALPGPDEQTRIAKVLDSIDEQIATTRAQIDKRRGIARGLLDELVAQKVWPTARLDSVATVDRGKFTHRPRNDPSYLGGPYPFIQTGDVSAASGGVISEASQSLSEKGARVSNVFPASTIAVTIAANIADTALLGIACLIVSRKRNGNMFFVILCQIVALSQFSG